MIVRMYEDRDALALFELNKTYRYGALEGFVPMGDDALAGGLGWILGIPGVEVVVAENEDGYIVGAIGMSYGPFCWNPKRKLASEVFMLMADDAPPMALLMLMRKVEQRKSINGVKIQEWSELHDNEDDVPISRLGKIYKRMGMRPVQTLWMGEA